MYKKAEFDKKAAEDQHAILEGIRKRAMDKIGPHAARQIKGTLQDEAERIEAKQSSLSAQDRKVVAYAASYIRYLTGGAV